MSKRICTKCKIKKELSEFYFRKERNAHGSVCKKCILKTNKLKLILKNPNKLSHIINKKELCNLYCNLKKSTCEIAKIYKCCNVAISFYLKKYNIKIRTNSERQKILNRIDKTNPNYKHGKYCTKHYCKDCGKEIDKFGRSKRCDKCKNRFYVGKKHHCFGKCPKANNWIQYQKIKFRSSWEANFAKWCDGSNIKWEYEPKAFQLTLNKKDTTYTPDFYLPEFDLWIEIKGWFRPKAKKKYKKFKTDYPEINIELFNQDKLKMFSII